MEAYRALDEEDAYPLGNLWKEFDELEPNADKVTAMSETVIDRPNKRKSAIYMNYLREIWRAVKSRHEHSGYVLPSCVNDYFVSFRGTHLHFYSCHFQHELPCCPQNVVEMQSAVVLLALLNIK